MREEQNHTIRIPYGEGFLTCPIIPDMKMECCETFAEAIALARKLLGRDGRTIVIPNGISVIIN